MSDHLSPASSFSCLRSHLRQVGLSRRDALSLQDRTFFSRRACSHVINYLEQRIEDFSDLIFSGYLPIKSEIDPSPLLDYLAVHGSHLALPAVLDSTKMVFRQFSVETILESMRFGTVGPNSDNAVIIPNFILVPLSAFDHRGHRLGYGGGYYDRAIASLKQAGHSIDLFGFGFSCQEVEPIPRYEHDLVLQGIFTEKGFLKC
ncbi:5-formyltetrahydrofolate cyclo-ligase [Bartonella sp. CB189]|uniref:5-formyltetrahydrofolate cyclo-ligase n=1 Tax=Bartonella sp. CB189 TaxID=3112254 RepID=UPI002F964A58